MLLRAIMFVALAATGARAGETSLVVGEGWLYARQQMDVEFTNATQVLALDRFPAAADPMSLVIFPRNSPMELLDWQRDGSGVLLATMRTDDRGPRSFDAASMVRGPTWRASYQIIVRADPDREDSPVSVDVDGRVTINSAGGGSWSNARVRLVGATRAKRGGPGDHGVLMLDDNSPLADLWRDTVPHERREFAYEFDRPVHVRADEERAFAFVSAIRRAAVRRYVLDSDDIASGGTEPGKPLRRIIAVPNDAEHGLGRDLPGGIAQIFLGSVRGTLGETAWLDRTPAGGEIRIELGRSERVRGLRRSVSSEPGAPGEINEQFEIVIRNDLESITRVEIREQPPVRQAWEILRSSQPYELRSRCLHFRMDVPAGETTIIRYITRSHELKI